MGYTFDDIQKAKAWSCILSNGIYVKNFLWERVRASSHDSDGVKTPAFSLCALLVWITGRNILKFQNARHDLQVIFLLLVTLVRLCVLVSAICQMSVTSAPGLQEDKRGRGRQLLPAWWRMGYFWNKYCVSSGNKIWFQIFFSLFWIGYYCKHRKLFYVKTIYTFIWTIFYY